MKITYDLETNTLTTRLKEVFIKESDEICEGFVADYDNEGNIVGLEIFDASHRVAEPQNMVFESMGHPVASSTSGQ